MGLAVLVGLPLAILCRLPHAFTLALIALAVAMAVMVAKQIRKQQMPAVAPAAVLAALLLWTVVDRSTSVAIDYYRFWGGSQRRVGDRAQAEQAYRRMLEVEPNNEIAHYYLGRISLMNGNDTEALEHFRAAQQAEPGRVRSYLEEAGWLASHGKHDEAVNKAMDAAMHAEDEQNRNEAKAVLKTLQANKQLKTKTISGPDDP
jgi:tetratricopeptide (TPR) repeat protein